MKFNFFPLPLLFFDLGEWSLKFTILLGNSQTRHSQKTGQELPSYNAGNLTDDDVKGIGIRSGANVRLDASVLLFCFPSNSRILVNRIFIFIILVGNLQNSHPKATGLELPSANDGNHTEDLLQNHDVLLSTLRSRLTKLQVSSAARS